MNINYVKFLHLFLCKKMNRGHHMFDIKIVLFFIRISYNDIAVLFLTVTYKQHITTYVVKVTYVDMNVCVQKILYPTATNIFFFFFLQWGL